MGDSNECVFCRIAKGEIPAKKIYENDNFLSFLDANPVVEGHSLVIPKKHFKTILDLPNTLGAELLDCIKKTSIIILDKFSAEGFNLANNNFSCSGQAVHHVHFHILPRKENDGKILSLHDLKKPEKSL